MSQPQPPTDATGAADARRARLRRLRVVGMLGTLVGGVALAFWLGYTPPKPPPPEPEPFKLPAADDPDIAEAVAVTNPGYVGIDTCAECHAARAAVVKTMRHYLACRPAPEGVTPAGFAPGKGTFATRDANLSFEMTRKGNDFFFARLRAPLGGEVVPQRIGLVYGSGSKHDEMYFAWEGDQLHHLPVAWLHPFDRWGQATHTDTPTPTHSSCLECHNTWVGHVPGTYNQYKRDDMLLGVTCERCHGPGKEHTDFHRAHPNEPAARAILHPGTLGRERLMDVCAQCHSNAKRLGKAFAYRPGEPLDAHFHNTRPAHQEDDTTNQVRYLTESKCFQKSQSTKKPLTCITCHDPHRPTSGAGGCANCHTPANCPQQPRLPAAVRGDCVGCHMPQRVWTHAHLYTTTDDKYVSLAPRADHRIGVYPEANEAVVLGWLRKQPDANSRAEAELLTAKITQHWTNEAASRLRAGRFKAAMGAYREALRIAPNATVREQLDAAAARQSELDDLTRALRAAERADAAVGILEKMLAINPKSAFAHGELGTVLARTGKREAAMEHLKAVAELEPADSYGLTRLAEMALVEGRTDDAAEFCARAHQINPVSNLNNHLWGQVLLRQARWSDAEKQFRKVLAGDPTDVGGNRGLSEALRQQGQAAEAVRFARRAAHWSKGEDVGVLLTLVEAYAAADRAADARKTLEHALARARAADPALVPTIRERLDQLR